MALAATFPNKQTFMRRGLIFLALTLLAAPLRAQTPGHTDLDELNARLGGVILDFTHNHRADRRIYSAILCGKRDMYIYLPPCFDSQKSYPLIVWLHGALGDEHAFLDVGQIEHLDQMIRCGSFPPAIVVCPDGTCRGENGIRAKHSYFINSPCCGRFEDHVMQEVVPFVATHFSVLPDKSAHALVGESAGGYGALALAIKYRNYFGSVATLAGMVNFCYDNIWHDWFADFSPETFQWRTHYDPHEVIGKYVLIRLKAGFFLTPAFGSGPDALDRIRSDNPANLLFATDLRPGELEIFLGFGGQDNFNSDAQAESFAWLAYQKGIHCTVANWPAEKHTLEFLRMCQRRAYEWLGKRLGPDTQTEPAGAP